LRSKFCPRDTLISHIGREGQTRRRKLIIPDLLSVVKKHFLISLSGFPPLYTIKADCLLTIFYHKFKNCKQTKGAERLSPAL
jgi:hypothetical protein